MAAASATSSRRTAPTAAQYRRIMAARAAGIYTMEDTRDEMSLSLSQMTDSDVGITLVKAHGKFAVFNLREFLAQLQLWKPMGIVCQAVNVREREIDGKTYWSIVIQPAVLKEGDLASSFCPLSLALGMMVSGFTYIVKTKALADIAVAALKDNKPRHE